MKRILIALALVSALAAPPARATLPFLTQGSPLADSTALTRTDPLTRTYLAPKAVVWQRGGDALSGADVLTQLRTGQPDLAREPYCSILTPAEGCDTVSLILDYGREIHGGIRLVLGASDSGQPVMARVRFGESLSETCAEPDGGDNTLGLATNDHAVRDLTLALPRYGQVEAGGTGFRFVRLDFLTPGRKVQLKEAAAVMRYRDIPYAGSFKCSDPRLDSIWLTGAYTVHLNMQEYLWDGIKRDRIVWLGDMHPEVSTITSVFGDNGVVERSLDLAVAQYPLPAWINGISAYSLWYLVIHRDWYMHSGNRGLLQRHAPYILGLIDRIDTLIDADGTERLEEASRSTLKHFLDWPSTPNRAGTEAGYRALLRWALKDASLLARILGDEARAAKAASAAVRLDARPMDAAGLKQAAALMALAGCIDPAQACSETLLPGGAEGFSTFYGYYMLEALAQGGYHDEAMDIISRFWGGMLDLGATTFWEDFDIRWLDNAARIDQFAPEGKVDVHRSYGDYCYLSYRHSLCHGWASGPTAWLTRHVLGVQAMEPGCATLRVSPHLGHLQWAEGTYPTPLGTVWLRHEATAAGSVKTSVKAPEGVKIIIE